MATRTLNLSQAVSLFYSMEEEQEQEDSSSSESESDTLGDEVDDPSFVIDNERDDEQPGPSTGTQSGRARGRGRGRGRGLHSRSRSPQVAQPRQSSEPWKTAAEPDSAPQTNRFVPRRTPGAQVPGDLSPLDYFQLFFSKEAVRKLCSNTNSFAAKKQEGGKKYKWANVGVEEFFKFLGLLIYTALVPLSSLQDYWKQQHILSVPFPSMVMTRDRFRALMWNIHPSDPEEDVKNDRKKGTPMHDKLHRVKPLMDDIKSACQAHYHPRKDLAVDERMVATKANTGMTQYMRDKPTKWGMKLFVLAESRNGYTINFNIYHGKTHTHTAHGLSYDAVMNLIQPSYLGTGYHIYVDNFYTSPKLFLDLASMKFGACGTYRDNRKGCPSGRENALTKKSERGALRWIREDPLLFVKWMDTREVSVCSTIHPAFTDEAVQRRVKGEDGQWGVKNFPCPTAIIAYNQHMGGVDLSDQLIGYYSTHRRTARWYRTLFLHFVDIATTNAYILHCEVSATQQVQHLTHKNFMVELVSQLCGLDQTGIPINRSTPHVPVPIAVATNASRKATEGRRRCQHCQQVHRKRNTTPWKCKSCDVALCVVVDRNCFEAWHI